MIFINYRTDDELVAAVYLAEKLAATFGSDRVFLDRFTLDPGDVFESLILPRLRASKVLVAVIGPRWAGVRTEGSRRLDDDRDWVRSELREALGCGVRIIPVILRET